MTLTKPKMWEEISKFNHFLFFTPHPPKKTFKTNFMKTMPILLMKKAYIHIILKHWISYDH